MWLKKLFCSSTQEPGIDDESLTFLLRFTAPCGDRTGLLLQTLITGLPLEKYGGKREMNRIICYRLLVFFLGFLLVLERKRE